MVKNVVRRFVSSAELIP